MTGSDGSADPHVHVTAPVGDRTRIRTALTQALGRPPRLPVTVTTGCRERRPLAMTSVVPERVTCLPCREAAHRAHLRWAEVLEFQAALFQAALPTTDAASGEEARRTARRHRDLARRFAGG